MVRKTQKVAVGLVVAAALAAPGAASAAEPATQLTACGNIPKLTVSNIQADGVPCDKARQVAKEYARKPGRNVAGFQCSHQKRGRNSNLATCTQGERKVTFYFKR